MGRHVELEGHRVVYQAVDRRVGGHLVAKDPVPLAEREVAGHHHRAPSYWLATTPTIARRRPDSGHVGEILEQDHCEQIELT